MTDRFLLAVLAGMLGITLTVAMYFIYTSDVVEGSCNGTLICEDE